MASPATSEYRGRAPVATLRGAAVAPRRRLARVASWALAALVALVGVLSVVASLEQRSRIERIQSRGLAVSVTITRCQGALGGSGSNGASFTCEGRYRVEGSAHRAVVQGLRAERPPGSTVAALVDPSQLDSVSLASFARRETPSSTGVFVGAALILLGAGGLVGAARRRRTDQERD